MMRALVTGVTGFVGAHLVRHLVEAGDQVVGLSESGRWPEGSRGLDRLCRLERLDLLDTGDDDFAEFLRRKQPEAIYHLAAQSNPRRSLDDPRGTWALNLGGTLNLLEAVRRSGLKPRVILVSSGVVYGNPAAEHLPVNESCPVRPNNPYSASKAAADLLGIQHALSYGSEVVIARPFNHSGPGQADTYVLASLARQVAEVEAGAREEIVHGDLSVVRDFTDVRDIVRAYRLLAERGRAGEIYNIGTGRDVPLQTMLELLKSKARRAIPDRVDPALLRAVDQPRLLADSAKLRGETGWEPKHSLESTLGDMLENWRGSIASTA